MQETLDYTEGKIILSDKDIFIQIWTSPAKVFKYLNDNQYDNYVSYLLILAGISRAFDRAAMNNMGDHSSLLFIVIGCVVGGGLLGWISFYFYAALISWTGGWLHGQGNTTSILRMLAHAMIPSIAALIFLIPEIAIYGNETFKSDGDLTSAGITGNIIYYSSLVSEFALGIYTLVLCVIGISEVQKFSTGKAILNLLLPVLLIVVPIAVGVLVFKVLEV